MTPARYAIVAYVVGLGLMALYAARLWLLHRALGRRERERGRR